MKVLACGLSALLFSLSASATDNFYLDYFANYRSGTTNFLISNYDSWSTLTYLNFRDDFNDGIAPPTAPNFNNGNPTTYGVKGTFAADAEQGGLLLLNPNTEGGTGESANGTPRLTVYARLPTNSAVGGTAGLRQASAFAAEAHYQLAIPDKDTNYGIRLSDQVGTGNQDDYIELRLRTTVAGTTQFSLIHQDFLNSTANTIGTSPFAVVAEASQVGFLLLHSTIGSASVEGFYRLYDTSGTALNSWTSVGSYDIFHGEDFTQASFIAAGPAPVPELPAWALLACGLGLLLPLRKRRS